MHWVTRTSTNEVNEGKKKYVDDLDSETWACFLTYELHDHSKWSRKKKATTTRCKLTSTMLFALLFLLCCSWRPRAGRFESESEESMRKRNKKNKSFSHVHVHSSFGYLHSTFFALNSIESSRNSLNFTWKRAELLSSKKKLFPRCNWEKLFTRKCKRK